ncbi:MAG TPA: hypothetical protein DHS57_08155 [Erysipelotrichaceae bacterium]|nr:hypothetical protein [Erysipelotrichaceae bacterium]
MIDKLTNKELEKIVKHIGETYRKSVLRREINAGIMQINENSKAYKNDSDFIFAIDCYLNECSRDTKCIIENEYLKKKESLWYLDYYTKSTYYRLKKKAIIEFINCMNL